jgi:hypothetical protein
MKNKDPGWVGQCLENIGLALVLIDNLSVHDLILFVRKLLYKPIWLFYQTGNKNKEL